MITKQMVDENDFYFYEFPKTYINFYSERKCIDLVRAIQETGNIEIESKGFLLLKNMLEYVGNQLQKIH